MRFEVLCKAALAVAVSIAAASYAWQTFAGGAETVHAYGGGVEQTQGYVVTPLSAEANRQVFAVTKYAEDPSNPGERRHCLAIYEVRAGGKEGSAKLFLMGSRCIEYDMGPDLVNLEAGAGDKPADLRRAQEEARTKANEAREKAEKKRKD